MLAAKVPALTSDVTLAMSIFNVQSVMDVLFKKTEFKHLQGRNSSKALGLTFDSWQSRKFIFDFLPSYRWATATLRYLKCDRISAAVCASWLLGCCNSSCCFHVLFSTPVGCRVAWMQHQVLWLQLSSSLSSRQHTSHGELSTQRHWSSATFLTE